MTKTNYTVTQDGNNTIVNKNGSLVAQGFTDTESAMHCVWVMEGKQVGTFFVLVGDEVIKQEWLSEVNQKTH